MFDGPSGGMGELMTEFIVEPLGPRHNRNAFSCGVPALDRYLQKQASQDVSKYVAVTFVITPDGARIAGFYSLSSHAVSLADLPEEVGKKLPRYPEVPATFLGRLAVSSEFQGHGVGKLLLANALGRVLATSVTVATTVVVVDAKDEALLKFYIHHGFIPLSTRPNRLIYPVKTIAKLGISPIIEINSNRL
jgi:ribosomal protein S18 acetylase RimI-like enzyme